MNATTQNTTKRLPQLRAHTVRGTAYGYATFDGVERRYGRLDEEGRRLFAADLATWLDNGRRFPDAAPAADAEAAPPAFTVRALHAAYEAFVTAEHDAAWRRRNESRVVDALDVVVELFGDVPAADFGPLRLKAVREHMCSLKRSDKCTPRLSVKTINERVRSIVAAWAWAVSEERIPSSAIEGLRSVKPLREGRPGLRGKRKVLPVERAQVDATLPYLSSPWSRSSNSCGGPARGPTNSSP